MSKTSANDKYYKIHSSSADSQLDLFGVPYTRNSILSGDYIEHRPVRTSSHGPLEFEIETGDNQYVDLNTILLRVLCKVTKADGSNIPNTLDGLKIWPVNNFLDSTIASLSVSVNGREIEYESYYPQRAYLEKIVNGSSAAKAINFSPSLYIEGDAAVLNTAELTEAVKTDLDKRKNVIKGSRTFEMLGKIHCSFFAQDRMLFPNCKLRVKLIRSTPEYCLMRSDDEDTTNYKVDFQTIELLARTVEINPSVINAHNTMLSKQTLKYPINKVESLTFSISAGKLGEKIQLFSHRQQPKRVFIALVDQEAKYGSYAYNPNKFHHFDIEKIGLELDGHPYPKKPLHVDFSNNIYTWAWFNFLSSSGMYHGNEENGISLEKYKNGYTIFAFDLTGDLCEGEGVHLIKQTTTLLEIAFKQALTRTVCVYVYAELDDMIEIDRSRTVTRTSTI